MHTQFDLMAHPAELQLPLWVHHPRLPCAGCRFGARLFFAGLRGLARLCTYTSSVLSVISGALSFTVPCRQGCRATLAQ
jgi:hypothetical protein